MLMSISVIFEHTGQKCILKVTFWTLLHKPILILPQNMNIEKSTFLTFFDLLLGQNEVKFQKY